MIIQSIFLRRIPSFLSFVAKNLHVFVSQFISSINSSGLEIQNSALRITHETTNYEKISCVSEITISHIDDELINHSISIAESAIRQSISVIVVMTI